MLSEEEKRKAAEDLVRKAKEKRQVWSNLPSRLRKALHRGCCGICARGARAADCNHHARLCGCCSGCMHCIVVVARSVCSACACSSGIWSCLLAAEGGG